MRSWAGSGLLALVLGTSRVYDQHEKYPTAEDVNQHSPGKLQRMDAGSAGCPARKGLLEQAELWSRQGSKAGTATQQ